MTNFNAKLYYRLKFFILPVAENPVEFILIKDRVPSYNREPKLLSILVEVRFNPDWVIEIPRLCYKNLWAFSSISKNYPGFWDKEEKFESFFKF